MQPFGGLASPDSAIGLRSLNRRSLNKYTTFFIHTLHPNGAAKYCIDLANAFLRHAITPAEAVTTTFGYGQMSEQLDCGLKVVERFADYDYSRCVFGVVNSLCSIDAAAELKKRGIPYIVVSHEFWDLPTASRLLTDWTRFDISETELKEILLAADKCLFVAETQRRLMPFVTSYEIVTPGVEIPAAVAAKPRRFRDVSVTSDGHHAETEQEVVRPLRFCCVGSVTSRKNQLQLIRCFLRLSEMGRDPSVQHRERLDFRLDVVGLWKERQADIEYGELCCQAAVQDPLGRIRVHPTTLDVDKFYRSCDVHILLSNNEVTPVSIMEAAARGLPSVAKRVGAIHELIVDGETGVLIDEAADDEQIVQKLLPLFMDRQLVRDMSTSALRRAKDLFHKRRMSDRFLAVLARSQTRVFLVALDGAVCDWETAFRNRWQALGHPLELIDPKKSADMRECVPPQFKHVVSAILSEPGFYSSLQPVAGALEGVRALQRFASVEVFLVTDTRCSEDKLAWVGKHLRSMADRLIFAADKTLLHGDYLVDPQPTVRGVNIKPSWAHIVYAAPCNSGYFEWSMGVQDLLGLAARQLTPDELEASLKTKRLRADIDKLPSFAEELAGCEEYRKSYSGWRVGKHKGARGEPDSREVLASRAVNHTAQGIAFLAGVPLITRPTQAFASLRPPLVLAASGASAASADMSLGDGDQEAWQPEDNIKFEKLRAENYFWRRGTASSQAARREPPVAPLSQKGVLPHAGTAATRGSPPLVAGGKAALWANRTPQAGPTGTVPQGPGVASTPHGFVQRELNGIAQVKLLGRGEAPEDLGGETRHDAPPVETVTLGAPQPLNFKEGGPHAQLVGQLSGRAA